MLVGLITTMRKPLFVAISGKKGSGKDELAKQLQIALESSMQSMSAKACFVDVTHFADPLKEMCIQLFGLDRSLVYGSNTDKEKLTNVEWDGFPLRVRCKYSSKTMLVPYDFNKNISFTDDLLEIQEQGMLKKVPRSGPMTHRELLQVMGTDIFRERVYNNIWAELPFKKKWEKYKDDDYGFDECIRTNVVLIADCRFINEVTETLKNGGMVIRVVRETGHVDAHPSETALDGYDWNQPNHFVVNNNGTLNDLRDTAKSLAELIKERLDGT